MLALRGMSFLFLIQNAFTLPLRYQSECDSNFSIEKSFWEELIFINSNFSVILPENKLPVILHI